MSTHPFPLFPLPMAVCPFEPTALHIFEPRYKELVAHCRLEMNQGRTGEFAIHASDGKRIAPVGCTVRITRILRTYDDGRMDLIVTGQRRTRLLSTSEDQAYLTGHVSFFGDEEGDWDDALATRLYDLHRQLLETITGAAPPDETYSGKALLSFMLAPTSGLGLEQKNELLELQSEDARMTLLVEHLEHLLPTVRSVAATMQGIASSWEVRKLLG